jgi:GNAT superfamily N-acetyltransferase
MTLTIETMDPRRWPDLCQLFGPAGASSGCWCMFWRLPAKEWSAGSGRAARDPEHGNRAKLERVVASGEQTGLLAYVDGTPAGWCAVAPREAFPKIYTARAVRPDDPAEPDVWSVTCFFVGRPFRHGGLARSLLAAAVDLATAGGAAVIEGYPVDPSKVRGNPGDFYTGTVGLFAAAGFVPRPAAEPGRRTVMRKVVR